jgi:transposase
MTWIGYKVHLTETCEDESPNLITHVETTTAPVADGSVTPKVHRALKQRALLPKTHLVDTGFLDAEFMVTSREEYDVELLGATRQDRRWQARAAEGDGAEHVAVDFAAQRATCPEGHTSVAWVPRLAVRGNDSSSIRCSRTDCADGPARAKCTRQPRRAITVRPSAQSEALRQRRQEERRSAYAAAYAKRAGIEATVSQGVRRCGMRRSRYRGLPKTHVQHVATAAALNFVRAGDWLTSTPGAQTRRTAFTKLAYEVPPV